MREHACLPRRAFLLAGGSAITILGLGSLSETLGATVALQRAAYAPRRIGRLSALEDGKPITFRYPWNDYNSTNVLVKLGIRAGGGVGPGADVVAFSTLCTHMGGPLGGQYRSEYRVLGPCPLHLTTFDLTRHGMVAAGQATESLPQIVLETRGDEIWATGVMGLIFGYHSNVTAGREGASR